MGEAGKPGAGGEKPGWLEGIAQSIEDLGTFGKLGAKVLRAPKAARLVVMSVAVLLVVYPIYVVVAASMLLPMITRTIHVPIPGDLIGEIDRLRSEINTNNEVIDGATVMQFPVADGNQPPNAEYVNVSQGQEVRFAANLKKPLGFSNNNCDFTSVEGYYGYVGTLEVTNGTEAGIRTEIRTPYSPTTLKFSDDKIDADLWKDWLKANPPKPLILTLTFRANPEFLKYTTECGEKEVDIVVIYVKPPLALSSSTAQVKP